MNPRPVASVCSLLALILLCGAGVGATSAAADDEPVTVFALGLCCTDTTGTNCLPSEKCAVSEMCMRDPYSVCTGDNGNADAVAWGTSTTYPPAFSVCDASSPHARIESSYDPRTSLYTVSDALLRFDTSSLGATGLEVVSARLQLVSGDLNCARDQASLSVDDKFISGEWYNWDEPTAGCDAGDYGSGSGETALSGVRVRKTGCYQVMRFELENLGNINRVGPTYLRLYLTPDSAPTGTNAFEFSAIEELYVAPALLVTYTTADRRTATARFVAGQ